MTFNHNVFGIRKFEIKKFWEKKFKIWISFLFLPQTAPITIKVEDFENEKD